MNIELTTKLIRLEKVLAEMELIQNEYAPLKYESLELKDEINRLEIQQIEIESAEGDEVINRITDGWKDDGVKTIAENEAIEFEQLAEEKNNPENYVNSDQ
jgi:hypothetical protein